MRNILIFAFITLAHLGFSQYAFNRIIGNANATYARDVVQTSDTGFVICGSSSGYGNFTANGYLMKLNPQGNFQWTKSIGGSGTDWFIRMHLNSDKTMVMVGYTNSKGNGGYDIWVVKTDSSGNVIWDKTYGGGDWDFGRSISATQDGGYIICGETYSFSNGNQDAFLLKLDMNGDSLWMKNYGYAGEDDAYDLVETAGGNFVFIGSTESNVGMLHDMWLVKTDNLGNQLWENTYGSTKEDFGKAIALSSSTGELYISGDTDSMTTNKTDMVVIRTDSSGAEICYYPYGGTENENNHDIAMRYNSTTYLAGKTFSYGFPPDMIVYYTDVNCFWNGGYTIGYAEEEGAWAVKETSDSGYVLLGDTKDGPGMSSIFIIKLNGTLTPPPAATTYFDVTAIDEKNTQTSVNLFPNPSNGLVNLAINTLTTSGTVRVFSYQGKLVYDAFHSDLRKLDFRTLEEGFYLLQLEIDNQIIVKKMMITHAQ